MSNSSSCRSSAIIISNWLFSRPIDAIASKSSSSCRIHSCEFKGSANMGYEIGNMSGFRDGRTGGEAETDFVEHERDASGCVMGR
ncbi:hypothetical protein PanWU01x14_128300 [Parasponia andersonii]|uniref:Uncharacterized protein n=1 Tax=Parasponia andersonii TaxID=3476 RepID=A0A2P5CS48_PARAD|nr:hypothetical protein PanWU01x14_128300 [Parasponia andersonii]